MADILNLISTSSQNDEERYKFIENLLVNKSDVPFSNEEVNLIQNNLLSLINGHLNKSASRHEGLKLLLKTLPQCSKEVLLKHGVLWMTKAFQILDVAQDDVTQVTTACRVIAELAIYFKEVPELQKQVSMQNVKQLIAHANGLSKERRFGGIFYTIAVLLRHYPEPCERLQVTLKKLILPLIDSGQNNLVRGGARCFALLNLATERSYKPPANRQTLTAWTYGQILICNSLHETMDALFSGVTEIERVDIWDKLTLPIIPQTHLMTYYSALELRFNNLCVFLDTMLRGCGVRNSVSPSNIFKVLSRGLFITPTSLGSENTFKKQILHLILPNLHTSLLNVLDAVVSGFGKELAPYAQTILQLLQQVLTWTGETEENSSTLDRARAFGKTRIKSYESLSTWLLRAGVLSGFENLCEEFLSHILRDIFPEKDKVVLSVQKTHRMSKRALKQHREKQYEQNPTQIQSSSISSPMANADLAKAALIALQNIFLNTGCRLKVSFHEASQNAVVSLLYDCYLELQDQTFYKRNSSCRLHLLKALKMLQLNPHPLLPPPTQYILEIYQMAQNDWDANIIEEVKIGLAEVEKIVHPSAPTLRLPISVDTETQEDDGDDIEMEDAVDNSEKDVEAQPERSSTPAVKNVEDDRLEDKTDAAFEPEAEIDASERNEEEANKPDNEGSEGNDNSRSIEIGIEIHSESDVERIDNASKDDSSSNENVAIMSNRDEGEREDVGVDDSNVVSSIEDYEPLAKRQNIENDSESIVIMESSREPEGGELSDDDAMMLGLFSDTVQEKQQ